MRDSSHKRQKGTLHFAYIVGFCLIRFFTSHQQSLNYMYVGTGLHGLNQH